MCIDSLEFSANWTFVSALFVTGVCVCVPVCGRSWGRLTEACLCCVPSACWGFWSWYGFFLPWGGNWWYWWRPWTMWPRSACYSCSLYSYSGMLLLSPVCHTIHRHSQGAKWHFIFSHISESLIELPRVSSASVQLAMEAVSLIDAAHYPCSVTSEGNVCPSSVGFCLCTCARSSQYLGDASVRL